MFSIVLILVPVPVPVPPPPPQQTATAADSTHPTGMHSVCIGEWSHWDTKVKEYHYPKETTPDYGTILVPNVDNVRTDFLIHTIAKQGKQQILMETASLQFEKFDFITR